MKIDIPTIFLTASSIINTRTFLSTHCLTSTWCILLARLVFPISNSFPYWWVASWLPRIFELPCFAPFPQHPWSWWYLLVLTWKVRFKTHKGCKSCQKSEQKLHNKFKWGKKNITIFFYFFIFEKKNSSIQKNTKQDQESSQGYKQLQR